MHPRLRRKVGCEKICKRGERGKTLMKQLRIQEAILQYSFFFLSIKCKNNNLSTSVSSINKRNAFFFYITIDHNMMLNKQAQYHENGILDPCRKKIGTMKIIIFPLHFNWLKSQTFHNRKTCWLCTMRKAMKMLHAIKV